MQLKSNSIGNRTLNPKEGDIILNKIILLMGKFKTFVLIISPLGNYLINGGSFVSIQQKCWIVMFIYTIITWCFALFIMRIIYS